MREQLLEISISEALGLDAGLPAAISLAAASPTERSFAAVPPATGMVAPSSSSSSSSSSAVEQPSRPRRRVFTKVLVGAGGLVVLAFASFGVWKAVEGLRKAPDSDRRISLQLLSDPPGATVTLDGHREALLTPYVFELPYRPEVHVRLEVAGYAPHEETVAFAQGEREKVLRVALRGNAVPASSATPDAGPGGRPPVIGNLEVAPATATFGERTAISGSIHFNDPDGDIVLVMVEVKGQTAARSGKRQRVRLSLARQVTGKATFTFAVTPQKAEPHEIELWAVDEGGQSSNHLSTTLSVVAKEGEAEATDAIPEETPDAGAK